MKKYGKYISLVLICLLGFAVSLLIYITFHQIHDAKQQIADKTSVCLEASIKKYIELKSEGAYHFVQHEYDPDKKKEEEYEDRIFKDADTTFSYRSKVVDPTTDLLNGFQSVFLEIGELSPDSIQIIFDGLLQAEGIHTQSIIGITSSYYIKKSLWSADTTKLDISYRTAYTGQGIFEDIDYYAYIHYSFSTIWGLMYKPLIYLLSISSLAIGIVLFRWMRKREKETINSIELRKDGNYRIKDIIYYTNEKRIVREGKEVTLPSQLHELFLLFLEANEHKVTKAVIKKRFWPSHSDATSNMTSNVRRLNDKLSEVGGACTIATDEKDNEYYVLS